MAEIVKFLANLQWYWYLVIIFVVFLVVAFMLLSKKFRLFVYQLVLNAEENITGEKKGPERYEQVVAWIYDFVSPILKIFLTKAYINRVIERAVARMKSEVQKK